MVGKADQLTLARGGSEHAQLFSVAVSWVELGKISILSSPCNIRACNINIANIFTFQYITCYIYCTKLPHNAYLYTVSM